MGLIAEDSRAIRLRIRELSLSGRPMEAMYLQQALDADEMPDPTLMRDGGVQADVPLVGGVDLKEPPRHGRGSGQRAWAKFAAKLTNMDAEVLERMQRDDIIRALEAGGNIPSDEEE